MVASISKNGLREPIIVGPDGRVIDGRHRLRACQEAGVEPQFEVFGGNDDDILKLVIDLNVNRRHLDTSQRAMIGARLVETRHGGGRSKRQRYAGLGPQ